MSAWILCGSHYSPIGMPHLSDSRRRAPTKRVPADIVCGFLHTDIVCGFLQSCTSRTYRDYLVIGRLGRDLHEGKDGSQERTREREKERERKRRERASPSSLALAT